MLRAAIVFAIALITLSPRQADAQQCNDAKTCERDADCDIVLGERCASAVELGAQKFCQVICTDATGGRDASKCEWGQSCAPGRLSSNNTSTFSCQPSAFGMDLNLLDTCISHFLEGVPVEFGENACSLESRLASMMGDGVAPFDIFDLDRCIQDFLDQPACSAAGGCGVDDQGRSRGVYCDGQAANPDAACGGGLFCNTALNRCDRQCGYIPDRSRVDDEGKKVETLLERPCAKPLHVCDLSRGKCEPVGLGNVACEDDGDCSDGTYCRDGLCQLTCALDTECPSGAYCQLGQCQAECYRNTDCADSSWYCDAANRCQPRPTSATSVSYDPTDYSVRFGVPSVRLDTFEDRAEIPVVIMSNRDQREVFSDSNILFGYRLEARYGLKDSPECKSDTLAKNPVLLAKCRVSPDEYFLLQERPFGTVYGTGDASMAVRIDHVAVKALDPGNYPVNLRAFFSNGSSASVDIMFHKPSVSGTYSGGLSLYSGGPPTQGADGDIINHLGDGNVSLEIKLSDGSIEWNKLLAQENLKEAAEGFEDLSYGQIVRGHLSGNESPMFDWPDAKSRSANRVRVAGIYNAAKGRMRLIGVVDLPKGYCRAGTPNWACSTDVVATKTLEARSRFGRDVRRIFQWIGPYDSRTGRFSGMYREVIAGLTPTDLVLEGAFSLSQTSDSEPEVTSDKLLLTNATIDFPTSGALVAAVSQAAADACKHPNQKAALDWFKDREAFECYLGIAPGCEPAPSIFPDGLRLGGAIGDALEALNEPGNATGARTMSEQVKSLVTDTICDDAAHSAATTEGATCVDRNAVACGLALYRKALVSGWLPLGNALDEVPPTQAVTGVPVFCADRPGAGACPTRSDSSPSLYALQEHGMFYRDVVGRAALDAGNEVSDAFFKPYTAQNSGALGAAIALKRDALFRALKNYDTARGEMFSASATQLLYAFPAEAFLKNGEEWILQMRGLLDDQLSTLTEVADTERRLAGASSAKSFVVAQHALHVSFLERVLVAALEAHWEGSDHVSSPGGSSFFSAGSTFLAKLDETKTPLGVTPNRTYFVSTTANKANWAYIRDQLWRELNDRSDVTTLASRVALAQESMNTAIQTRQSLTKSIGESVAAFESELDRLCGSEEALPVSCGGPAFCDTNADCRQYSTEDSTSECKYGQCTNVRHADIKAATADCRGDDCEFPYRCETPECNTVARVFRDATNAQTGCRADTYALSVPAANGANRPCMRGEVGALMQERELLEMRRKHVINLFSESLRKVDQQHARIAEVRRINDETEAQMQERKGRLAQIEEGIHKAQAIYDKAMAIAEQAGCISITGAAAMGGNCISGLVAQGLRVAATEARERALKEIEKQKQRVYELIDGRTADLATDKEVMPLYEHLDNLTGDVSKHVGDYETVVQQLFNLDARIADTHFVAQRTAERYQQEVEQELSFFAELTGFRGNAIHLRNAEVIAANQKFQRALLLAYELVQAVRYELAFDYVYKNLRAESVYQAITLKDLQELLAWVDDLMSKKCELYHDAGIGECQSAGNSDTVVVSLQRAMFPYLTDIVDPETGTTLTVGQQFHRLITSSAFVKKRMINGDITPQIELPFGIWLGEFDRIRAEDSEGDVTPRQCGMLLQPQGVAVEVVGNSALTFHLPSYLIRGGTDLQRSCSKPTTPDGKREIKPFSVGWLANSSQTAAEFQSVASFQFTRVPDGSEPRWVSAFADRSLSAPSYLFTIPLNHADGKKLVSPPRTGERPLVNDILLHFKYRSITFRD
jgi:hypothetical protein